MAFTEQRRAKGSWNATCLAINLVDLKVSLLVGRQRRGWIPF